MELLIIALLGLGAGTVVGLLPGIGPASLLLITFPFLYKLNLLEVFTFYFSMLTSTQYYGSVCAIVYGVPGEISSMPAVKYGHSLFRLGKGSQALMQTATGSFLGALFAIFLLALAINHAEYFQFFFKNSIRAPFILSTLLVMIMLATEKWKALILALLGILAGKVGYDSLYGGRILTFSVDELDAGIPFYPMFMGFIIIPTLWHYAHKPIISDIDVTCIKLSNRFQYLTNLKYKWSMLRGATIGFCAGLIPGASYTISSNLSASFENKFTKSPMANLVSAETANNAGSISVLLPLLLFAIPIVPSESLLLAVAQTKGFIPSNVIFITHFWLIIGGLITINTINWILSGMLVQYVLRLHNYAKDQIYKLAGIICLAIMNFIAYADNQLILSVSVFVIALIAATIVKLEDNKFIFIFAFFISDILTDELYRFYQLNF